MQGWTGRPRDETGGIVTSFATVVLLGVWVAASCSTGFLLALLAGRIHPSLSLARLWLFYTVLMAVLVAVVFIIGWT